jgi:transposase
MFRMYSCDLRIRVINTYKRLRSSRKVSLLFQIHHSTVCRWVHRIFPIKKKPYYSLSSLSSFDSFVSNCIQVSPLMSHMELLTVAKKNFTNVKMSLRTIQESIKRQKYTKKRIKFKYTQSTYPDSSVVSSFAKTFMGAPNIISIDESGFADRSQRSFGYSRIGTECVMKPFKIHFQSTLLLSISKHGNYNYRIFPKGVKGIDFLEFLQSLDSPAGTYILMDNCSIHKSKIVREYINQRNWIPLYTPPYCPDMNPVEMIFGILKRSYRKQVQKSQRIIESCIEKISRSTYISSFSHVAKLLESY